MVETRIQRFGRIDILVNNAAVTGKAAMAPFLECSEPLLDRIIDVNLKGVFHCSQTVATSHDRSRNTGLYRPYQFRWSVRGTGTRLCLLRH